VLNSGPSDSNQKRSGGTQHRARLSSAWHAVQKVEQMNHAKARKYELDREKRHQLLERQQSKNDKPASR